MFDKKLILKECRFKTSRSSGPGGQHTNKVETRVTLLFNINESNVLNEDQKQRIIVKLSNKINSEGVLRLSSQKYKSQFKNKTATEEKMIEILEKALKIKKKRKKTKIPEAVIQKRLNDKKVRSEIKRSRENPKFDK